MKLKRAQSALAIGEVIVLALLLVAVSRATEPRKVDSNENAINEPFALHADASVRLPLQKSQNFSLGVIESAESAGADKASGYSADPQGRPVPTPRPQPTPAARPSAPAQWVRPYPIGVWGQYGVGQDIDPGLVANLGIVGIGISDDWDVVNPAPGVYDWSTLDAKIAEAKAAGFQYLALAVTDSASQTPQWLLESLPPDQIISLIDPASTHTTFCQPIVTALPWNATFHQARLDLIAAMGAKYTNDPAIVAVNMAAFANHNTQDWNIQDTVGTIICPSCPQPPPTLCGSIFVDQPSQWLAAGWTEPTMLEIGEQMCDAAAAAFPNQNIKLPIGGLDITYPDFSGGTYTTLCRDIENYVYGNGSLGIPPRPYVNRFYMQRNTVDANWGDGTQYDTFIPGFNSDRYIKYMIRAHAHPNPPWTTPKQAGLQMVSAASLDSTTGCRQGGGPNGPCGPTCDPVCVMQASLDVARTYGTAFIEIWAQDDSNPLFYEMITAATIAMGGTPRNP